MPPADEIDLQRTHPTLGDDEIRLVVAACGCEESTQSLAIVASLCKAWRFIALERLRSMGALRPNHGEYQRLAHGLKAKDPTFMLYLPRRKQVAIAESSLHRIVLHDIGTGVRVKTFGKFGWAPGAGLNYPKGLAVDDQEEHLYVCDRSNHRVCKLLLETGELVCCCGHREGARGVGDALFRYPQGIAFSNTTAHGPTVFVCDYGNDRCIALDAGDLSYRWSCGGAEPSQAFPFALPAGVCATADECFVVDASHHCVHVFSCCDGVLLRTIGAEACEARYPWGIALSPDGTTCFVAMGAASGGRRGRLQALCPQTGAELQPPVSTPGAGRLSGVCCTDDERVFVVDHDARCVCVLTSHWEDLSRPPPPPPPRGDEGSAPSDGGGAVHVS